MKRMMWAALIGILLAPATARAQDVVVYYHTDAIGSVRAMTDETGALIHRYDFLPFGEAWDSPPNADTRQFAGKERDRETGLELDYFGARYHLPLTGRFTTVDPVLDIEQALVDSQRWNRYAYSLNNPLKFTDPDGRSPTVLLGGVSAVIFGGVNAAVNVYQGRPWHENVGVAAATGFVVGATLGLAAPAIGAASATTVAAIEAGAAASATAGATAKSAYDIAIAGGKHAGFLQHYASRSTRELAKAIGSIEGEIATHFDKIKNPAKYIEGFAKLDPRQQKHLLEMKWPGDIQRQREQLDILHRLIDERF